MKDPLKRSNKYSRAKRIKCALLCLVVSFIAAVQTTPAAYAADYNIDTTNFKDHTKSAGTIYYWHAGLPPAKGVDGTKYPVLITWDDKYFLSADGTFVNTINKRKDTRLKDYDVAKKPETGVIKLEQTIGSFSIADRNTKLTDKLISGSDLMNNCGAINGFTLPSDEEWARVIQERYGYSSGTTQTLPYVQGSTLLLSARGYDKHNLKDFIFTSKNDTYGQQIHRSYARTVTRFNMSSTGLLAGNQVYQEYMSLKETDDEFIDELLKNGFAATTTLPDLPYLVLAEEAPAKNIDTGYPSGMSTALTVPTQSRWAIWLPANGSTLTKENNWLVGAQHFDAELVTWRDYTHAQGTSERCDFLYDFYLDIMSGNNNQGYDPRNFIDPGMRYQAKTFQGSADDAMDICMQKRTWVFGQVGDDNKYYICASCGLNMYVDPEMVPSDQITNSNPFTKTGVYALTNLAREGDNLSKLHGYGGLAYFDEFNTAQRLSLLHDGSTLVALGSDSYFWAHQDVSKSYFSIFWAEPISMNFYRTNFTVVDGQVANIDGPACIDEQAVYRVKSGGVLVMTDWVINNGAVLIEKGGTLIITDNTDAYGHKRYCTLMSQVTAERGGRIACDGTIIIMPNCKCFGGGTYGIQLGDGANVVNYGVIGAENFTCYRDYTIENRITDSVVILGTGIVGSGFSLTNIQIRNANFPCAGHRESTYAISTAKNMTYGKGAGNVYMNPSVSSGANKTPTTGSVVNLIDYRKIIWTFTCDQKYNFTFPAHYDLYGSMRNYYMYTGQTVDKLTNGQMCFHTTEYIGGIQYQVDHFESFDDVMIVTQGGYMEANAVPGMPIGTLLWDGFIFDWVPPEGTYFEYQD